MQSTLTLASCDETLRDAHITLDTVHETCRHIQARVDFSRRLIDDSRALLDELGGRGSAPARLPRAISQPAYRDPGLRMSRSVAVEKLAG